MDQEIQQYKIMVTGDAEVGKTCFLQRYVDGVYGGGSYVATVGIDFRVKTLLEDGVNLKFQMWDAAGQERYRTIVVAYYRGSNGIFITFDITNEESFTNLKTHTDLCNEHAPDAVKVLVGFKGDLADSRAVSVDTAKEFAEKNGMKYFEVSAKDGTNVEEAVDWMIRKILEPKQSDPKPTKPTEPAKPVVLKTDLVSTVKRFKVPLMVLFAAVSIYVVNKYFMKSSS